MQMQDEERQKKFLGRLKDGDTVRFNAPADKHGVSDSLVDGDASFRKTNWKDLGRRRASLADFQVISAHNFEEKTLKKVKRWQSELDGTMIMRSAEVRRLVELGILPPNEAGIVERVRMWSAYCGQKEASFVYSDICELGPAATRDLIRSDQSKPEIGTFAATAIKKGDFLGEYVGATRLALEAEDEDAPSTQDCNTQQTEEYTNIVKDADYLFQVRIDE